MPRDCPLVEVTQKTIRGRFLLRPSKDFNEIFLGCLGRAQRLYPVEIMGVVCLSNHYHLLLRVEPERCLSEFMWYLNTNLAKEVNRLRRTSGPLWARRFHHAPVVDEASQVKRFRYLLSHGVKEHLVKRCRHWPGVHLAKPLLDGERGKLHGFWFNRTREYNAKLRGEKPDKYDFAEEVTVELSKLPCMKDLSDEQYRRWVKEQVHDIETTCEAEREREGLEVLGAQQVRRADPFDVPKKMKKSPAPRVHAATKAARKAFYEAYSWFLAAYREAAEKLKAGVVDVVFPEGCFPPAMPYVPYEGLGPRPP